MKTYQINIEKLAASLFIVWFGFVLYLTFLILEIRKENRELKQKVSLVQIND